MSNDKPTLGFETPSKEIEDAFTKAREELAKTKTDWQALNKIFVPMYTSFSEYLNTIVESKGKISGTEFTILLQLSTTSQLSKLGAELAEVHQRLTKVERDIRGLKLIKK